MMKRKQAKKIERYFDRLINKISTAEQNVIISMNVAKAKSFVKALKLTEAIDRYTFEEMQVAILTAEEHAVFGTEEKKNFR